jgi:outer membrane receptor protein involved in Fe transport
MTTAYSPMSVTGIYNVYGRQNLQRIKGQITGLYNFGKAGELTIGAGYLRDRVKNTSAIGTPGLFSPKGDSAFSVYTESRYVLFQYVAKIKNFGFTAGSRYENTSFGEAFAPRAGITFLKNKLNAKLLYGNAYRIPTPWQAYSRVINYNPDEQLVPELAHTIEFEIGYKLNDIYKARLNTYYINIDKPISYLGSNNSYHNFGRIQSLGMEAELTAQYHKSRGFLNLSFNKPGKKTSEGLVTANKKFFLGMPRYIINMGGFHELRKLIIGVNFTWLSEKYGESQDHALGITSGFENTRYEPIMLTNLNIAYKNLIRKITVNVSVFNLFNQKYLLVQPSYGAHAPMPANDRQITLGVKLNL